MPLPKSLQIKLAKWTLSLAAFGCFSLGQDQSASAHLFGHHHGFGYYGHVGYHGYAGIGYSPFVYRSVYTSYYGLTPYYYPTGYYTAHPFCHRPRYYSTYSVPYFAVPVQTYYYGTYPVLLGDSSDVGSPVIASQSRPSTSYRSIASGSTPAFTAPKASSNLTASTWGMRSADTPLMMLNNDDTDSIKLASADIEIGPQSVEQGSRYVASKPAVLQPYSPIWTKAASGIVDDMVAAGQMDDAFASCRSMEKIDQPKGAGVYLRQALLSYFANRNASNASATEDILGVLDQACAAGSQLQPSELAKTSLSEYFEHCSVDVNDSMEQLSRWILDNPKKSGRELLLLSALLKLEGQSDRAKLFAAEASELASQSTSFHWNNLLSTCQD